jgi:hypothetical protein
MIEGELFDATLPACEDWDFWLRLAAHGPLGHIRDALTFYRAPDEYALLVWSDDTECTEGPGSVHRAGDRCVSSRRRQADTSYDHPCGSPPCI